jgi:hypothetical protein
MRTSERAQSTSMPSNHLSQENKIKGIKMFLFFSVFVYRMYSGCKTFWPMKCSSGRLQASQLYDSTIVQLTTLSWKQLLVRAGIYCSHIILGISVGLSPQTIDSHQAIFIESNISVACIDIPEFSSNHGNSDYRVKYRFQYIAIYFYKFRLLRGNSALKQTTVTHPYCVYVSLYNAEKTDFSLYK